MTAHPAKFSDAILRLVAGLIPPGALVLDPYAGTGRVHSVAHARTFGVEIEPEWASMHPDTVVGDALQLPFGSEVFDVVVTSPSYGNRLADSHTAKDGSRRHSYTHTLRRATGDESRRLHPNNSGTLHWGARYREHHVLAWGEVQRVLKPGGWFILNTSNHVRSRQVQRVTEWHHEVLAAMGFEREILCQVSTPRLRDGENADARVDFETVARFIR